MPLPDNIVTTMTHDLKGPLAAIMGYADLLADPFYGEISDNKRDYAEKIKRVGDLMLMQINNIVALSRVEAGDLGLTPESFRLAELADELAETFAFMAGQGECRLEFDVDRELVARADRARLKQMLQNLLSNAVRLTPAGGRIRFSAAAPDDRLAVEVFNTDTWIAPEDMPRLFEKFGHVGKGAEGSGMGLFVARRLAEAQGGTLEARSSRDEGTTFRVELPLHGAVAAPAGGGRRVLVVGEGSPAEAARRALASDGYGVNAAASGLEGLQRAADAAPEVIVLCDTLPDLEAADFLQALALDPRTQARPVVLLGNTPQPGCTAVLPLTADAAQLRDTVRAAAGATPS